MLSKAKMRQVKLNVLNYWRKQEQILKDKIQSLSGALKYERDTVKLNRLLKFQRNNTNKLLKARAEIRNVAAELGIKVKIEQSIPC